MRQRALSLVPDALSEISKAISSLGNGMARRLIDGEGLHLGEVHDETSVLPPDPISGVRVTSRARHNRDIRPSCTLDNA